MTTNRRDELTDAERWDELYGHETDQIWSGAPNGSLVAEAAHLPPGRALDVGCGEGGDAIWLAQRGWQVTAVDISGVAVERARAAGSAAGVAVDWRRADLLAEPPCARSYDLVSLQYPALRREAGPAATRALIDALAPGGTLLVVGHAGVHTADHQDHCHEHQDDEDGPRFDPSEFFGIDDLAAFATELGLRIETDEVRPRPNPPVGAHHVDDAVLRASRPTDTPPIS